MFDVGFWEILFILILALVVIGPERLPSAARKAGYYVGKARRFVEGVRSEVESELDIGEFKRLLHNQEVQINELQQQIKTGVDEIKSDLPSELSNTTSAMDALNDTASHAFYDEPDDTKKSSETAQISSTVSADPLAKDEPSKNKLSKDAGSNK